MLTVEDFVAKYDKYTDGELYMIYKNIDHYSEDAGKALDTVLAKRGGIKQLIKRLEAKAIIANEKKRIADEATLLGGNGVDADFIKKSTSSTILSEEELQEIIELNVEKAELHVEDVKVNSETILKSFLGFGLATLAGGVFASLQLIYLGATSAIMVVGMILICYGTVKLVTKKSYNNTAVLFASFLAFIFSYLLGYLALLVFGYLG